MAASARTLIFSVVVASMVLLLSEARRMDCAFAQAGMAASSTRKKKRVVRIERSPESRFDLKYIPLLACRTWERIAIGLCGDAAKSILLAVREKMPASEDGRYKFTAIWNSQSPGERLAV